MVTFYDFDYQDNWIFHDISYARLLVTIYILSHKSYFEVIERPNIWWNFDVCKSRSLKVMWLKVAKIKSRLPYYEL